MSESEERLRRIEILLGTCAKVTVSNQTEIRELRERSDAEIRELRERSDAEIRELRERSDTERAELRNQLARLADMFTESVGIMRTMQEEIQTMQYEVKGLQTENKRILDHLFGESQN